MAENEIDEVPLGDETEGKRGGILPLVAILVVTLAGGGFMGVTTLGPKLGPALAARAEAAPKKSKGGHGGEGEATTMHVVDNLVVNPASSGGSRFLLTSIALLAPDADAAAEMKARDLEIRDAFIMVLGTLTVDELTNMELRPEIIRQLLAATRHLMGPEMVTRILLPQFVIQ